MNMRVDERGERMQAPGVDHLGALRRLERPGRSELRDPAVADQEIALLVDPRARVDEPGAADEDVATVGERDCAIELRGEPHAHAGCGSVAGENGALEPGPPATSS